MPPTSPQDYFLQQGQLGVIIVVLSSVLTGVIIWMQKRYDTMIEKKDVKIEALNQAITVLQEKRVADNAQHIQTVVGLGKDLMSSQTAIQKSVDGIARIVEIQKNNL